MEHGIPRCMFGIDDLRIIRCSHTQNQVIIIELLQEFSNSPEVSLMKFCPRDFVCDWITYLLIALIQVFLQ